MTNLIEKLNALTNKLMHALDERQQFGVPKLPEQQFESMFDYESLANILHYDIYDEHNRIFYNKASYGFVLEATTLIGANEQVSVALARIINDMLPEKADLQFLLWGSDKVGPILANYANSRANSDIFSALAQARSQYLGTGAYDSLVKDGPNLARHFRLLISLSLPSHGDIKDPKSLIDFRENFVSRLATINMHTRDIDIHDFLNVITDLTHPRQHIFPSNKQYNAFTSLAMQMANTDQNIKVHPAYLSFETQAECTLATSYNIRNYPTHAALAQMDDAIGKLFDKVNQIPCPFLISMHIRLANSANSSFLTTVKAIDSEKSAKSKQSSFLTHLNRKANEMKLIQSRLHEGDKLVETYFQVTLFAQPDDMIKAENNLLSLYESNGWSLQKITKLQLQSWLLLLPMRMTEMAKELKLFGRFYTMSAFNAANLVPILSEWNGTKTPHLLLMGRRGQLTPFSPHDNDKGNFNMVIAAQSGSGKSVLGQEYVGAIHGTGGKVWVIDIGRSFQRTCEMVNGTFIDFDPEQPHCINPFTHIKDFAGSLELLKTLIGVMARPSSKISDEEYVYLEQAISAAWLKRGNDATIKDVASWLEKQEDEMCHTLSHLLYSYTKGGFKPYFEGKATIDLSASFVVLELERLIAMPHLLRIVLMALSFQITEAMYFGSKFQTKTLLIDEYWRYSKDCTDAASNAMGEFIGELARTVRKYNGGLVTIVQSIEDYFTKPEGIAVYNNSDCLIVMRQKDETIAKLSANQQLSMNAYTEQLYKSIEKTNEYSELLIKGPNGISLHRLILDPFSRILYSSKAEEFEAVKHYRQAGLGLVEAIRQVVKDTQHDH